jgi:hypothetical protein
MSLSSESSSPFFARLPRELRDEIYSYLLIHPTPIHITATLTPHQSFKEIPSSQQEGNDGTGDYPSVETAYGISTVPVRRRATWTVPLKQLAPWNRVCLMKERDGSGGSWKSVPASSVGVRLTYVGGYAYAPPEARKNGEEESDEGGEHGAGSVGVHGFRSVGGLHCFLVCRTMYEEAREVFYAKNTFVAAHHTAFMYFLRDRPIASQGHIRGVKIHISEALWDGMRHEEGLAEGVSAEGSFGEGGTEYCEDFERLFRVLSGPEMQVGSVEVSVYSGGVEPSWSGRVKIADCLLGNKGGRRHRFW